MTGWRRLRENGSGRYPCHPKMGEGMVGAEPPRVMKPPCWAKKERRDYGIVDTMDMP
jgi:hypothetical protein